VFNKSKVNLGWKMDLRGEHDTSVGVDNIVDKSA